MKYSPNKSKPNNKLKTNNHFLNLLTKKVINKIYLSIVMIKILF